MARAISEEDVSDSPYVEPVSTPRPSQPSSEASASKRASGTTGSLADKYLNNLTKAEPASSDSVKRGSLVAQEIAKVRKTPEPKPATTSTPVKKSAVKPDVSKKKSDQDLLPTSTARADFAMINDSSATATKAQLQKKLIGEKAEADLTKWIEAVIGDYLPDSFVASLRSGEILCMLINKIQPGLVKKFHVAPRMAFKQMENIGQCCLPLVLPSPG